MINSMHRLKRLEEAFEQRHPTGQTKLIFQNVGETESEALEKAGINELDDNDLNIFLIKWCSATTDDPDNLAGTAQTAEPEPETIESVNQELESLKAQLQQEGNPKSTVLNNTPKPKSANNNKFNEVNENIDVEPMRADPFLTGMSR
ncbi:MAG: hypothetical protein JRJ46_09995 [Deltaproteobacteria bacterium]|nr:hypothetical protein [Deltaproteobacteria bacterium]